MGVLVLLLCQPIHEGWEVVFDLFPVENPVYHMTTKESHFYFVPCMSIYLFVFMNNFENIRSSRSVSKFKLIKRLFIDSEFISLVKILYWYLVENCRHLVVGVFKKNLRLHNFLIELIDFLFVLDCLGRLKPFVLWHASFAQTLWHLIAHQALKQRLTVEQISLE